MRKEFVDDYPIYIFVSEIQNTASIANINIDIKRIYQNYSYIAHCCVLPFVKFSQN